jgi:predicted esterase YcpF (UPF0227 family)
MTRLQTNYIQKQKQLAVIHVLQSVLVNPGLRPKNLLTAMEKYAYRHGIQFDMTHGELVNWLYTLLACQLVDDLEVCLEQSEPYKVWYATDNAQIWLDAVTQ